MLLIQIISINIEHQTDYRLFFKISADTNYCRYIGASLFFLIFFLLLLLFKALKYFIVLFIYLF